MSADESFNRIVKVRVFATIVGGAGDDSIIEYSNNYTEFSSVQDQNSGYNGNPGFRIKAKITQVEATIAIGINPITFQIYNLGPDSRALFQSRVGTKIQLLAGYNGNAKQIAVGNILWAETFKEGTDYITDVIAGDGHFAQTNGDISISFSGPVTYKQIVEAILSSLEGVGISAGTILLPPDAQNQDIGYNTGFVMSGSPLKILAELCQKMRRSMTIVGNFINIIPVGQDIGAPVIEISEDSGLIGIPKIRPPGLVTVVDKKNPVSPQNDLSFTSLLRPEIGFGQKIKMVSKFVNGEYTCTRVVHDVDSWSGPFYTNCEAFKLQRGK